jgi:aryl-alcohol dehydrogenase-like predicted oxidoreductase
LSESLRRFDGTPIDILMLHRDETTVEVRALLVALNRELEAGTMRTFGASNWSTERLGQALAKASASSLAGFTCSSPNLSLARQHSAPYAGTVSASSPADRAWYARTQLTVFAWSAQAGGFFTPRHAPRNLGRVDPRLVRAYHTEDNWTRRHRAAVLGRRKSATANQVALAWVLNQPFPTHAIIGPATPAELRSSVDALDLGLDEDEMHWLDDV